MTLIKARVLIVEDEPAQLEVLTYNLKAEGHSVRGATNGEQAMQMIEEELPDLVILDWMMPLLSGIEVCRRIKTRDATKYIPVIMLSARSEDVDSVRGLDTGADDYVTKPFSVKELMARVRTQLRRSSSAAVGGLTYKDIILDPDSHRVSRDNRDLKLGPIEFRLLSRLMERPGRVFSRDQLLDLVWGPDIFVDSRTVDVHVARLRKTLTCFGGADPIRTVRSAGYSLG